MRTLVVVLADLMPPLESSQNAGCLWGKRRVRLTEGGSTPKPPEIVSSEFRGCPHSVTGDKSPIAACTGNLYRVVGAWEPIATGFFALFL